MCISYTTLCILYKSTTCCLVPCVLHLSCWRESGHSFFFSSTGCVLEGAVYCLCSLILFTGDNAILRCHLPFFFLLSLWHSYLETILSQELWLPHVLPLRKVVRNPNAPEVLDTFLQLLLWSHLLLVPFPLCSLSFPDPEGSDTEHVSLATHLCLLQHVNLPLRHRTVQRLDVGLPSHRATDHSSLRGTCLWLGLRTRSGEVVEGSATLSLTLTFVAFAAAVTVRGRPPGGTT